MQHRFTCEAVDRTFRDLLDKPDVPFGGIPVAWGGDFQQTLTVIPRGSKEQIVESSIQHSPLWQNVKILFLKKNMRVEADDPDSQHFAQWLLDVGHGKDLPLDHTFEIPQHMLCGPDVSHLISEIYPNIQRGTQGEDLYFLQCAILCPRNSEVNEINTKLYSQFPGQGHVHHSADIAKGHNHNEAELYPVEYLNSLNFGGLPPSRLELKIGVPLMLLCNLDPGMGLCNGTQLWLLQKKNACLEVKGPSSGKLALIPCIPLTTDSDQLRFQLQHRQFPVRLAFAMTINKSQGQSLGTVGLDLRSSVFGHGQLYVGLSRGSNWNRVKVLLGDTNKTANIVYKDVLLD